MRHSPEFRGAILAVILAVGALWAHPAESQSNRFDLVDSQLISLDADATPVVTILEILAERTGLNIVTAPEVQGRSISIRLRNTPFSEALNLVVRAAGLGYEPVGNSILVADPERLATQTGLTTRVFTLEYANAAEVTSVLDVISESVRSYSSGNRIVVKAPQSVIEEISQIVEQVDVRPAQVMLEARLVEVNTTALKELGIDWNQITDFSTILVEGNPGPSAPDELPDDLGYFKFDDFQSVYRQAASLEVAIDLMVSDGNAKLLANSKITTMDNQAAEIFIGQTIPVVISTLQNGNTGGTFQSVSLEYIDVGVKLNILPRISSEGFITSVVSPEVSNIVGFGGTNNDLPQTSTRRASSVVRVKDGQKFYLGGLLQEVDLQNVDKVPVLGDIPLIKYFFRHYRTETRQTDLLIEITPVIIRDQG